LNAGDRLRFDVEEFDVSLPVRDVSNKITGSVATPAADSGPINKRPGSWADTAAMREGANRTKYIAPGEIKLMMDAAPAPLAASAADSAIDAPHLQILSGSRASLIVTLPARPTGPQEWSVGSHGDREVVLPDGGVSALHAKLVNDGQHWKVIDQLSANGTFVNGKRSTVSYLSAGDRLGFGPVECVFQLPGPDSASGGVRGGRAAGKGRRGALIIAVLAAAATLAVIYAFMK
jgi:hypothetical protein